MSASTSLGRIGEQIAFRHLESSGLEVLDRNWSSPLDDVRGELDLVAREGDVLVVVEVKTRRDDAEGALAAVTPDKQARLRRLAAAYLSTRSPGVSEVRIDVIGVSWTDPGGRKHVDHVRGVC